MSHASQPTNVVTSTHQVQVGGKSVTPTAVGTGNALEVRGDMGIWDTVAGKFVLAEQTSFGTTASPKVQ